MWEVFYNIYWWSFCWPLYRCYRLFWWTGRTDEQICCEISGYPVAPFWNEHSEECSRMISDNFAGWMAIPEAALYYAFILTVLLPRLKRLMSQWRRKDK